MANTSQKHKEKRSQKRKDRQLRRAQKKEMKESKEAASKQSSFMVQASKSMKGTSKSLPGFLAKHSDTICRWLNDYCLLFQKADDAYIDYLKFMERDKRNALVQDYVDIRVFLSSVQQLKNKISLKDEVLEEMSNIAKEENNAENEEVLQ